MNFKPTLLLLLLFFGITLGAQTTADSIRITELDAYWTELERTVREGDFEGYKKGYHEDAILVFNTDGRAGSYPIAQAFGRWKQGFDGTRAGKQQDAVEFRLTQRIGDANTAHETGIFRFTSAKPGTETAVYLVHFEMLMIKKAGVWLAMMEFQKERATEAEWRALE